MSNIKHISPWLWVPTLYFAEGIPYFLVNNVSVMMLTRMGVSNSQMALFTSLLYLPWTIKPLWSPFVDIIRTKRWWILSMQIILTLAFIGLTISLPHPAQEQIQQQATPISAFSVMLILFWITAFASATHDIAADGYYMLALTEGEQSFFVGIRSTFYRISSIFGQGVLLTIAGLIETKTGQIPFAWQITLLICSVLFAFISLWHILFLPWNESTRKVAKLSANDILRDFARTFVSFFKKPQILLAIVFMLLYRLPEAFLIKILNPFFVGSGESGGLEMTTQQVGIAYGTVGVILLTIGGILGGIFVSRRGLKRSIWLMALSLTLPDIAYLLLSLFPTQNFVVICSAIGIEQFGYGFGFTAYMLYMIYVAEGESKTSHYALCTAFMALSMMIPGMFAGYLQENVGYSQFFMIVMICCLFTIAVTHLVYRSLPADFGKQK